jgi:hypothetical protein
MSVPPLVASRHRPALQAAARGIALIRTRATATTLGVRFPALTLESSPGEAVFEGDAYDGAAGIALVLMEWAHATGDDDARALARDTIAGLIDAARPGAGASALYLGRGALAVLALRAAGRWRDAALRDVGVAYARGLVATGDVTDLLYGAAGAGLAQLAAWRASRDRSLLAGVRATVTSLADTAERDGARIAWRMRPGATEGESTARFTGLAHGSAGILWFLAEAADAMPGVRLTRTLRDAVWNTLAAQAEWPHPSRAAWPKSDRDATQRHHWCHGTAGIAQALARWATLGGGAPARRLAVAAGEHAWHATRPGDTSQPPEQACQCHGRAGMLVTAHALATLTGDARWRRRTVQLARGLAALAPGTSGPASLGADDLGWATGTAGVVAALLLAEGGEVAPIHDVRAVRDLRGLRSARPTRTVLVARRGADDPRARALVPQLAAPALAHDGLVFLPSARRRPGAALATALLAHPRSAPARAAMAHLTEGLARLEARHRTLVKPGALTVSAALVRQFAGLAWYGADTPVRRRAVDAHVAFHVERHLRHLSRSLDRLAVDREGVLASVASGRLASLVPMSSDPHRGGQFVVRVAFEDGTRLVLKPRDVRVDWYLNGSAAHAGQDSAAQRVARWMRARGDRVALPAHGIVPAGPDHGYAECLVPSEDALDREPWPLAYADARHGPPDPPRGLHLATRATARAFWSSAGALASHLALFGVTDQHAENLVVARAAGARAATWHAIDCEVALLAGGGVGGTQLVPHHAAPAPLDAEGHTHFGFDPRPAGSCSLGAEDWALVVARVPGRARAWHLTLPRPGDVADRWHTHLVQNPDGGYGAGPHLGAMLRGLAAHWGAAREHGRALIADAERALDGAAVRILAKTTAAYASELRRRALGGDTWPGHTDRRALARALPFFPSELRQVEALDVPRYERRIGTPGAWWSPDASGRVLGAEAEIAARSPDAIATVVRQALRPEAFAFAVMELVRFFAPLGSFDLRDDMSGVRVRRVEGDAHLDVVILLDGHPAQFRIAPEGRVWFTGVPRR